MLTDLLNVNLVQELGLDQMPKEQRDAMIGQMEEVLHSRISLAALSYLSDEDKKELDKVLDSDADLVSFLRDKIPNFDVLVAETVAGLKKEMLELAHPAA